MEFRTVGKNSKRKKDCIEDREMQENLKLLELLKGAIRISSVW